MKNQLLLLLSIIIFTLNSCSSDGSTLVEEDTTTETTKNNENDENNSESATLNVTLSGRDNYENIYVSIRIGENNNIVKALKEVTNNGTISLDVTPYINQELVIKVHEKTGDITAVLDGTTEIRTIIENDNDLAISIPEANIYGAKIQITIDGIAKSGITVYALSKSTTTVFLSYIKTQGSSALSSFNSKVTDSNGFVEFEDLDTILGTEYHFVVITNEPVNFSNGTYQEVILDIDGILKEGNINIESAITGNMSINLSDSPETGILVEVYDENDNIAYSKISTNSNVSFNNIPVGTYEVYASKITECIFAEQKSTIVVSENMTNQININFRKSLKLTNESDNPYTVTITDSENNETSFVMDSNTEKELDLPTGATAINVIQNSGYLFYATENDFVITISCNQTYEQSFPK